MTENATSRGRTRTPSIDWWLVALLVIPVLYFLPEVLGLSVFAGIDTTRLNMPIRFFDRQAFASGALPLWNPYLFAGFPGLAESESGAFYPGSIFMHLPGDFFHWYSIGVVAHLVIAAGGFYFWMRIRGHSRVASAFLAATYSTTPFLIFHITAYGLLTSIVWLPWYFAIFELGLKGGHPVRTGLWLALFLAVMIAAGSVQAVFIGTFGLLLYAFGTIVFQQDGVARRCVFVRSLMILLPAVISPFLAALQLLPTAELSSVSERVATDALEFFRLGSWLNVPRLVSLIVFPALDRPADIQDYGSSLCYLGAVPFILAVASLSMRHDRKWSALLPLLLVGVPALILAFGLNLPGYKYIAEIPPFAMFRYPGRMAHLALTMFLPLAAPAIDLFLGISRGEQSDSIDSFWSGVAWGTGLLILAALLGLLFGHPSLRIGLALALFFGMVLVFAYAAPRSAGRISIGRPAYLLVVTSLVLSIGAQVFLTYPFSRVLVQERGKFDESLAFFDELNAQFPTQLEIPRLLMPGSHYLLDPDAMSKLGWRAQEDIWDNMSGNASALRNITALRGLTPLNQQDWKLVLRDTLQSRLRTVQDISADTGEAKVLDETSMRIIRMLGADVLILDGDDWIVPGYELWRTDLDLPFSAGIAAYRAVGGWVRDAHFVERVSFGHFGYAEFLRWAGSEDVDVEREAIAEAPEGTSPLVQYTSPLDASITGRERGFNWMRFEVSVEGGDDAFMVTGENYYPGWNVYIDGARSTLYKTDFILSGVNVPPGNHTIEMRYQPRSVLLGMIVSLLSLAVWALLMAVVIWLHSRGRPTLPPPIEENG